MCSSRKRWTTAWLRMHDVKLHCLTDEPATKDTIFWYKNSAGKFQNFFFFLILEKIHFHCCATGQHEVTPLKSMLLGDLLI